MKNEAPNMITAEEARKLTLAHTPEHVKISDLIKEACLKGGRELMVGSLKADTLALLDFHDYHISVHPPTIPGFPRTYTIRW